MEIFDRKNYKSFITLSQSIERPPSSYDTCFIMGSPVQKLIYREEGC